MTPADLAYLPPEPADAPSVSIFADRPGARERMAAEAAEAGFSVRECDGLDAALEEGARPLGDIVLVNCPGVSPRLTAALLVLDERVARAGAQLLVTTTLAALDEVFACCDRSAPQILVDPSAGERAIALGAARAGRPRGRLRELSREDRRALLRLTEQVGEIARRLERLGAVGLSPAGGAFRFESPSREWSGPGPEDGRASVRPPRPPLPDPRLVRRIIRQRRLRGQFLDAELFADPAWDILLDLTAARAEHARVSVTSLCIASAVPPTTALRWIRQMVEAGLLERVEDESDRRRAFIGLSERAAEAMARYFEAAAKVE